MVGLDAGYALDADPFYTGTGIASPDLVGYAYPVAIGGHPYLLDDKRLGDWQHASIQLLRQAWIVNDANGEKNLNPEGLWRTAHESWHKGAGQVHLDRQDSDPDRFNTSKGIDPWTRNQVSLLPDTTQVLASANTGLRAVVAGGYCYVADGQALKFSTDLVTWTVVAGTPAAAITALASDGYTVYAAFTANGVYSTTRGDTGAATHFVTDAVTVDSLGYVNGRVMASVGPALYNLTGAGALPAALYTHDNADFAWVGYAEGSTDLYAAGFSGDKSLIYKVSIKSDGTGLATPVPAAPGLPDGEIVEGIGSYLGYVLVGTSKGVRLAVPDSSGYLTIGAYIATGTCRCFEGQDRFVWFGIDDYDVTSTGLGRADLTVLNEGGAPAYATDLMVTGQGAVRSVVTFNDKRLFTVDGLGVYTESANLVPSGTIDSGRVGFGVPDDKVGIYLMVRHSEPLVGSHEELVSTDGGAFVSLGVRTSASDESSPFLVGELTAGTFEVRTVLSRDTTDTTTGPTLFRWTLLANPAIDTGRFIQVPLLLVPDETEFGGSRGWRDVAYELHFLEGLQSSGKRVTYQEVQPDRQVQTFSVVMDSFQRMPYRPESGDLGSYTFVAKLKSI